MFLKLFWKLISACIILVSYTSNEASETLMDRAIDSIASGTINFHNIAFSVTFIILCFRVNKGIY